MNGANAKQVGPVRGNTAIVGSDLPDRVSFRLPKGLPMVTDWLCGQDGVHVGLWFAVKLGLWARLTLAWRIIMGGEVQKVGSGYVLDPLVARDMAHRLLKAAAHAQLAVQSVESRAGWLDGP